MDYQSRLTGTRVTANKYPCMYVCRNKVNFFLPMPTSDYMDQSQGFTWFFLQDYELLKTSVGKHTDYSRFVRAFNLCIKTKTISVL